VYEERRRGESGWAPARIFGNVRSRVQSEIHALAMRAAEFQLYDAIKRPDWGLSEITARWMDGEEFEAIVESTDITGGDIVRNLRMAVQLMRQVRRAIDRDWDLVDRLQEAMNRMNRDLVDARRQLELG
jgi:superfamily II RNA helicase